MKELDEEEVLSMQNKPKGVMAERDVQDTLNYLNETTKLTKADFRESWNTILLLLRNPKQA